MLRLFEKLVGKSVTLICFGEYVGFIHFGERDHCRIESDAVLVDEKGTRRAIFPEPAAGALPALLGATIRCISMGETVDIALEGGALLQAELKEGYESVMFSVDGQTEVY